MNRAFLLPLGDNSLAVEDRHILAEEDSPGPADPVGRNDHHRTAGWEDHRNATWLEN